MHFNVCSTSVSYHMSFFSILDITVSEHLAKGLAQSRPQCLLKEMNERELQNIDFVMLDEIFWKEIFSSKGLSTNQVKDILSMLGGGLGSGVGMNGRTDGDTRSRALALITTTDKPFSAVRLNTVIHRVHQTQEPAPRMLHGP